MKKRIKKLSLLMALSLIMTGLPVQAEESQGIWHINNQGWWYRNADGSYPRRTWENIGDRWYYFDAAGYLHKGWVSCHGDWYYMDDKGYMVKGRACTIGNKDYYFHADGHMAVSEWIGSEDTGERYYDQKGCLAEGIIPLDGTEHLFKEGVPVTDAGWVSIGDATYYIGDAADIYRGVHEIDGMTCEFDEAGRLMHQDLTEGAWMDGTAERRLQGGQYYAYDETGKMYKDTCVYDKASKTFDYYDATGKWIPGDFRQTMHNAYGSKATRRLFDEATKKIGSPYVYATAGPDTFDCSGYIWWITKTSGLSDIPRYSAADLYRKCCRNIPENELKIGDYIFFDPQRVMTGNITHVGIYAGHGLMIHASKAVKYEYIGAGSYWADHIYAYGRLK